MCGLADKYFKAATLSKLNKMLCIAIVDDYKGNCSREIKTIKITGGRVGE